MKRVRRALGSLASRVERLFLPGGSEVPPLHLRWTHFRTLRRDSYRRFAAASAAELLSRGLAPGHRVLDVGCGIGPLALGLIPHLGDGSYDGFDIHPESIAWCRRAIGDRDPRFRFRHADLFNTAYNPGGTLRAAEYRFPYEAATFDFALLSSVCTHLLRDDAAHYLNELARVLRPGGRCVVSYYLLNDETRRGIAAGTSFLAFTHAVGEEGSRVVDPANPALAVAHPEELVRELYAASGLRIEEPIRRGGWNDGSAHQQDVITAVKP